LESKDRNGSMGRTLYIADMYYALIKCCFKFVNFMYFTVLTFKFYFVRTIASDCFRFLGVDNRVLV